MNVSDLAPGVDPWEAFEWEYAVVDSAGRTHGSYPTLEEAQDALIALFVSPIWPVVGPITVERYTTGTI